jgi:hypothetical protein
MKPETVKLNLARSFNMKQTVSFQLDKELVDQLKAKAEEQMITPSALMRIILVQYLKEHK